MQRQRCEPHAAGRSGSTFASDLPLTMSAHDRLGAAVETAGETALVTAIVTSVEVKTEISWCFYEVQRDERREAALEY